TSRCALGLWTACGRPKLQNPGGNCLQTSSQWRMPTKHAHSAIRCLLAWPHNRAAYIEDDPSLHISVNARVGSTSAGAAQNFLCSKSFFPKEDRLSCSIGSAIIKSLNFNCSAASRSWPVMDCLLNLYLKIPGS